MSKSTIFGYESFIDTEMMSIRQSVDKYILDELYKTSVKINVNVDEVRLEKWLKLCLQLENIEQSDLIDMAIKKRIADLLQENQQLSHELEVYKSEVNQLKSEQNKVAVEKLEELRARFDNSPIIFFHDTELNKRERELIEDEYEDAKFIFRDNIDQLLAELKGESDD